MITTILLKANIKKKRHYHLVEH
ncbi:Protein of unknown function [Bacillus wiedmannii]|nr:Protein of unknown function [Bacillus wiedmannii]SCN11806.1 Protein of unknown function [Bacillus wiedmannii]